MVNRNNKMVNVAEDIKNLNKKLLFELNVPQRNCNNFSKPCVYPYKMVESQFLRHFCNFGTCIIIYLPVKPNNKISCQKTIISNLCKCNLQISFSCSKIHACEIIYYFLYSCTYLRIENATSFISNVINEKKYLKNVYA